MNLHIWISAKLWELYNFPIPTSACIKKKKSFTGGVLTSAKHHKCFIPSMHRLGCWKVTVLFCADTCLCNTS